MKKNKLPSLVIVLVLTMITVVMWISFNLYRALTNKPVPAVPPAISNPLTPNLDLESLNQINSRIYIDESQIPEISPTQGTPAPAASPEPVSSPEPIPSELPATESANPVQ